MEEKLRTNYQGRDATECFAFTIPPKRHEDSGHTELITFSPPNNDQPILHDSIQNQPSPAQPADPNP